MSGYTQWFAALVGACLCALAVTVFVPAPQADAFITTQTGTEQNATINATLKHPCNAAEMVKVSGYVNVKATTYVDASGSAKTEIAANWSAVTAQNLTSGTSYSASTTSTASANLGLLPASAMATVSTTLTGSNGESLTAFIDLKVDVGPNGATLVQVANVRFAC